MNKFGKNPLFTPKKLIAIGDVHGESHKLANLLTKILPLEPDTHLVFCGDLVDRGEDSPQVLEIITNLMITFPNQVFTIRGNHDWMLLKYCEDGKADWFKFIGKTLNQMEKRWGLTDIGPSTIKQALIDRNIWFWYREEALSYYETDSAILTHAPLSYMICFMYGTKPEDFYNKDNDPNFVYLLDKLKWEVMWEFVDENDKRIDKLIPKLKICGHQYKHHKQPRIFKQRAFIDTGCGAYPDRPLTAIIVPSKKIIQSDN